MLRQAIGRRAVVLTLVAAASGVPPTEEVTGQQATASEEVRTLTTYPFSDPNPVPFFTRDERLYPYHSFEGYAHDPVETEWKVVRLENDLIEVFVLPEIGGKVWGAIVKESGHEFIYRNEVVKFRNIALRGPWTSGGIEFNFGVVGHTPATATPVDYLLRQNEDGSASVFVGAMDLASRSPWRVEIRLPPDKAYFETRVLWRNPTPVEQPYYNWMTGAAFARDDLVMTVPGDAYLEHPGAERPWPRDQQGRHLPTYDENRFGGSKSYHVVGQREDFFGGYYRDAGFGFGHWARHEDMPGQKIWLWALSRQGGIWEDLLTDDDGQYMEFQAGRLLVQYTPGRDVNPISEVGFDPGATDRWTETWFPVEGLGGLTDASREGAMFVDESDGSVTVRAHAFGSATDTLRVTVDGEIVHREVVSLGALQVLERDLAVAPGADVRVELPVLDLRYAPRAEGSTLARPFSTPLEAPMGRSAAAQRAVDGRQLLRGRRMAPAREAFEAAVELEPWNREALLGMAEIELRRARYEAGLAHVERVLQLDAYDPAANFLAGTLHAHLGSDVDAVEAYGWASRSLGFRTASLARMGELALREDSPSEALEYATSALDYDRFNVSALEVASIAARRAGDPGHAVALLERLRSVDPLSHFARFESAVGHGAPLDGALDGSRSEYPAQDVLEVVVDYVRRGVLPEARALASGGRERYGGAMLAAWDAWLNADAARLPLDPDVHLVFPFRGESIEVLRWVVEHSDRWEWRYLLALNLAARDRGEEAAEMLASLGSAPDYGPAYVTRAHLTYGLGAAAEPDLRRAVALAPEERLLRIELIAYLQSRSRWTDALAASGRARVELPPNYDLDLLHVRSLLELERPAEAIPILSDVRVLPSEHSSISQPLHANAHLAMALDALEAGSVAQARRHAEAAREWPERLGQGRPYEPEERLALFVIGLTGDASALEATLERSPDTVASRLDLLGVAAAVRLGRMDEVPGFDASTEIGGLAERLVSGIDTGARASTVGLDALTPFHDDVEGRLISRSLAVFLTGGRLP